MANNIIEEETKKPWAVFVDLESTGTNVRRDLLLEVGCCAVDELLNIVSEFHRVVRVEDAKELANATWPGFWKMHGDNGLLAECMAGEAMLKDTVDQSLSIWLRGLGFSPEDKFMMAGNSIGQFDHPMMHAQLPLAARFLSHRTVDVSATARILKALSNFPRVERELPHRALADCRLEVEELRDIRDWLGA